MLRRDIEDIGVLYLQMSLGSFIFYRRSIKLFIELVNNDSKKIITTNYFPFQISPCFGNRCLDGPTKPNSCQWSPFAKCETDYSACMPTKNRSPFSIGDPTIKCRWRRTVQYDECRMNP